MSSAIHIHFDEKDEHLVPLDHVPLDQWVLFCEKHNIKHSPETVGGNIYYQGAVEIAYHERHLRFSTYFMGDAIPQVARIALTAWGIWGGTLRADQEIRALILTATLMTASDLRLTESNLR